MSALVEFLIILALVIANGVFAMSEIAVVSSRKARLQRLAEEGNAGAGKALALAEQPDRFLSTVQIGITLIGTLAGAFGGASLSSDLAGLIGRVPFLEPYSGTLGLLIVVLLIAYLSLVIGELAPKRIGLGYAEAVAAAVAGPMTALSRVTSPLIRLLSGSTTLVIRLLGIQPSSEPPVTEEEVILMLEEGRQAGVFQAAEREIVENVFRFADRRVSALVTPYTELVWLDVNDPLEEQWQRIMNTPYSCFPLADRNLDNLLGIVCIQDLWAEMLKGGTIDLRKLVREPVFIPETAPALKLLALFREARVQEALVLDEHGSIMGLVTLTDLLESLIGDLPVSGEEQGAPIVAREDGSWLVDGLLPVDEFRDYFGVDITPEDEQDYQTLGGFIMFHLGRIPAPADRVEWGGLRLEVMDMDHMRVDKVLVQRLPDAPGGEPDA